MYADILPKEKEIETETERERERVEEERAQGTTPHTIDSTLKQSSKPFCKAGLSKFLPINTIRLYRASSAPSVLQHNSCLTAVSEKGHPRGMLLDHTYAVFKPTIVIV
jgi:hypothetical protein